MGADFQAEPMMAEGLLSGKAQPFGHIAHSLNFFHAKRAQARKV